jgi:hypothetical protein
VSADQWPFIEALLRKYKMESCHSVTHPMEPNVYMSDETLFPVCTDPESPMLKLYQSLTGELLFVAFNSVPEIMYVVHQWADI